MTQGTESARVERSAKRIRAKLGGAVIVDTERALLVWERRAYPMYYLPREDLRAELVPTGRQEREPGLGKGDICDLRVGERVARAAAMLCESPEIDGLGGHVRIIWDAVDAWFEEDEEIVVHPRDPYTRLDILPSSRHVVVQHRGLILADSWRPMRLFETGLTPRTYLPATDVDHSQLIPSETVTRCPYKGEARYFHLQAEGVELADIAWRYLYTTAEAERIAGLYCFHDEKVELLIDDERREQAPHPQPVR